MRDLPSCDSCVQKLEAKKLADISKESSSPILYAEQLTEQLRETLILVLHFG